MNSSIYFFVFYDFLWFTLDLYMSESLKCLMTSGSIESIETTNSLFLWVSFLFLFFHVFVKHKRDLRLKYVLVTFVFLSSKFYLCSYDDIVYNNVKLYNRLQLYSPDYIRTCNELQEACLLPQFFILTISKPKAINIIDLSTVWYQYFQVT